MKLQEFPLVLNKGGLAMPIEHMPPPPTKSKRNKVLIYSIVIMAVIGIACFCYYWFYSRFYQYTDDAYVGGNMIFLTPQVPGIVTAISADNTDYVVKGRVLVQFDKTDATIALEKLRQIWATRCAK